ncbi:MAG TPA: glucoamylase family protein, partial [Gemmataceae bacterium]|nr:glucoamylase family protein [Gemmataceae bacterium]
MRIFPALARHIRQSFLNKLFAQPTPGRRPAIVRGFRLRMEALESRIVPTDISDAAYPLLHKLTSANQANFYVYQDADSGFNHGFPSGLFAGDGTTPIRQDLIDQIQLNAAGVDDPASPTGISSDPNRLDRDRGTVMQITIPALVGTEFAGVNIEDPERYGNLVANNQPAGRGYDLTGAQRVLVEARSPTPGGLDVIFGVGERNTDRNAPYHLTGTFATFSIDLSTLRDPNTNLLSPPNLSDVHVVFSVVRSAALGGGAGTVLLDNIRFDPVPPNPTRLPNPNDLRPSLPLSNETFGVVPAVIHAVDDGDAEFTFTGNWAAGPDADSYQGDRHSVFDAGNGGSVATWTIANLAPRVYEVQATWAGVPANASNAPFTLLDGATVRDTFALDQREVLTDGVPNTSKFDGRFWKRVGEVRVESGVLNVQLSNQGVDGTVLADGVRLVPTIPPDQAIRNLTTIYESSLAIVALLDRGTAQDLDDARQIADSFLYALSHDSTGGMAQLPTTVDGDGGLRDAYSSGDLALFNNQGPGANDAQAGQVRLAGFSTDKRLTGPTGFALVLDGAFGGNDAFAIMALTAAYQKFGDVKYLDGAREIGRWIVGNLTDPDGPAFQPTPALQTFGGYFLGYPDQGVPKDRDTSLIRGKSIENNGDIFAAFSMLAAAESALGNTAAATEWTFRANVAGDFVMSLYDPGNPANPNDGHFNAGTLFDSDGPGGPLQPPSGPGLKPDGVQKQTDVVNTYPFLDSNTFTTLPLALAPRYRSQIDWREPVRFIIDTFAQQITATAGGQQATFNGFSIVETPTRSQFRPGEPIGGLPNGIAWEFAAQAVVTMRFVDALYGESEFKDLANYYQDQIRLAQTSAPFGDGQGIVAATVQGENDGVGGNPPLDQVLGTPFQAIAERVGLAATTWAVFADRNVNFFVPQLPLPDKTGETFVVDDWDNKVTETDLGSNYFAGNTGATETVADTTNVDVSPVSNGSTGGSLDVSYDFTGQAPEVFAGYFASLFGLTDTLVSYDRTNFAPTPFPGYYLDTQDIYRGFGSLAGRSVEQLRFDVRLESNQPVTLKIELQDEPQPNGTHNDVFARRTLTNTGSAWQTLTFSLPADFTDSVSGNGDPSAFDWRKVSTFSLIVERNNVAAGITNPDTGHFLVDNLALVDTDGTYPDLAKARDPIAGTLIPFYNDAFLDHVRATSSQYFLDFASTDARTGGIVQDRGTFADLLTVGGVGFQLSSYVVDAHKGYLSRADAANRTLDILRILNNQPQGPNPIGTIGYQGFFYHFLGNDGLRKQNFDRPETPGLDESRNTVELSPIDTALAIAGAVTSAEYFDGPDATETEIRTLVDNIYGRVNWGFMLDPASNQFYNGWKPNENRDDDSGLFGRYKLDDDPTTPLGQYASKQVSGVEVPATLDYYTDEVQLIALLAMGSPNPAHRLTRAVWDNIIRDKEGGTFVKTFPGSLFTYQFGSVWLDTQLLGTDNYPGNPVNFFNNTRDAIRATRDYAILNPLGHATLNANRWGLSATEGPFDEYFAEAAPPAAIHFNGTEPSGGMVTGPGGPIGLQGEAGTGDGSVMFRGNAAGGQTVQLDAGETRTLTFELAGTTSYEFSVRYSNDDNSGLLETVNLSIDGNFIGSFAAQDTGDGGFGWDNFLTAGPLGARIVPPGTHSVTVSVSGGDGFGVEIDAVNLTPKPVPRTLEFGTVTNYAVGNSIVHTPGEALAALWNNAAIEDLNQDSQPELLHPRFGFTDAFNVNIADVISDSSAVRKRSAGPWTDYTGFAIDHGPMLLLIDNYLEDQFVPGLFMSYSSISSALAILTDAIPPTVTIEQAVGQADPTNNASITFDVKFSEVVTGFDAADVDLSTSTEGSLVATVTGNLDTYTVTVTGMTTRGFVIARILAGGATDVAGNTNLASTSTDNSVEFLNTGTLGFTQAVYNTTEDPTIHTVTITVARTGQTGGAVSIDYGTSDGTAHSGQND